MRRLLLAACLFVLPTACVDDSAATCDGDVCDDADEGGLLEQAYEEAQGEGKEDGTDCSGVRVPDRSGFNKRVALTFDDGPNPATTPGIIATLKKHHAPAAFFNNGVRYNSQAAKDVAAQIAADPMFILANHSQNHLNLAQQSSAKVASEIDRTDALLRAAGETPKFFRFPFGSSTCATKQQAVDRGYTVTGWHIDSADWCYAAGGGTCKKSTFKYVPDALRNDMKGYILSQVRANNGGIMLMHDIHASTAANLDAILTALEAEGFTFVRIDDVAAFPHLNGAQPAPQKFIGDACTNDAGCAFMAGGQAGRCHPAGFCTVSCAGSCADLAGKAPTFCIADALSATPAGICVSKAATQNNACGALPNTQNITAERFIGNSTASPATANVCAPL